MPKIKVQTNPVKRPQNNMKVHTHSGSMTLFYALTSLPLLICGFLTYINCMFNNPMSNHYLSYSTFTNHFTSKLALVLMVISILLIIGLHLWKKDQFAPVYYGLSVFSMLLFFYVISHFFTAKAGLASMIILIALMLFIFMLCDNFDFDYTDQKNMLIIGGVLAVIQIIAKFLIPFSWITLIISFVIIALTLFIFSYFNEEIKEAAEENSFIACFTMWSKIFSSLK